jgi:hypothetical protein
MVIECGGCAIPGTMMDDWVTNTSKHSRFSEVSG